MFDFIFRLCASIILMVGACLASRLAVIYIGGWSSSHYGLAGALLGAIATALALVAVVMSYCIAKGKLP